METPEITHKPVLTLDSNDYEYKSEIISISPYCSNLQMVFLIEKIIKTIEKSMTDFKDLYGMNLDGTREKSIHYFKMFRNRMYSRNHGKYLMDEVNVHFEKIYSICNHRLIKSAPQSYFEIDNDWYAKVITGDYLHESESLEQLEAIYEQLLMIDVTINGYIREIHDELHNPFMRHS